MGRTIGALVAASACVLATAVPAWGQAAPDLAVEPSAGPVGTQVTARGQSLPLACLGVGVAVHLHLDGTPIATTAAGPDGSFEVTATIPQAEPGDHEVASTCEAGGLVAPVNLASTTFTVTEPPPAAHRPSDEAVGEAAAGPPPPDPDDADAGEHRTEGHAESGPPERGPADGSAAAVDDDRAGTGSGPSGTGRTATRERTAADEAPEGGDAEASGTAPSTALPPSLPRTAPGTSRAAQADATATPGAGRPTKASGIPIVPERFGPAGEIGRITDPDLTAAGTTSAAASMLLFSLLIGIPATMFDGTLRNHYDVLTSAARRRLPGVARRTDRVLARVPSSPVLGMALVGGLVAAALDASLALDARSAAVVVALVLTVGAGGWLGWWPTKRTSDAYGNEGWYRAYPAALFIAVACVLLTRFGNLHPGYLYGLLFAYETRGRWSQRDDGLTYALGYAVVLVVGLVAWAGLSVTDALVPPGPPGPTWVFADALLAGLTLLGVQGVTFGMVPFRFTPGRAIWDWSRRAWFAVWTPAALALAVLLSTPDRDLLSVDGNGISVWKASVAFAAYTTVALGFWLWARRRAARLAAASPRPTSPGPSPEDVDPDAVERVPDRTPAGVG